MSFRIGTAGWTIPGLHKDHFSVEGSHLEKYARTFNAVEINSSFYREHKPMTYRRWAESVPSDFKFSVKLNKIFTHEQKLEVNETQLAESLNGIQELEKKWGVLLVQIPPSLQYKLAGARKFFKALRKHYKGAVAFEPRHLTWLNSTELLKEFDISKVKADPEKCSMPEAESQSPCPYERRHGSPKIYYSEYSESDLKKTAAQMRADSHHASEVWCIFDNTALFHATNNALQLKEILDDQPKKKPVGPEFSL